MGLSLLNPEFPSPAGRFLLLTTKVGTRTLLSKKNSIFFLDAANLEFFPWDKNTLSWKSQSHEILIVPQKEQKWKNELRRGR